MKKTLKEEKQRIVKLMEQGIGDFGGPEPKAVGGNNPDQPPANNPQSQGRQMELDDHVYCPLHIFMISAHPAGEGRYDKDAIDFTVKGDVNMQTLKIVNVDVNDDYTDEEIDQSRQLVEKAIRKFGIPSGASFLLSNPKGGNLEF